MENENLHDFEIKNHPHSSKSKKHILLIENLRKKIDLYSKKNNKKKSNNISIFVGATGSIIEALDKNIRVFHLCEDPVFESYDNKIWPTIKAKYLDKNSKGEYKKFDRNKLLVLEIVPTKCERKETYSSASNSKGIETAAYACFIKKSIDSEGNAEKETISIQPFSSKANCLKPTHLCQGTSPNFIGNFFD